MNILDEYRDILRMIDSLEESLYLLDAKATRCTTHMSDEIRCPALYHDRIAEIVVQKCEISNRINRLVLQKDAVWKELLPHMRMLDAEENAVITWRYFDNMPWKIIAQNLERSRFSCYRILLSGLKVIATSCGSVQRGQRMEENNGKV